jgi:hypothetical protein
MADYYPVLKKTVAALPENTGAARREIYQRARKAIVAQLKGYDPPLSPSEITAEQLRLEESIRRVEAEAARDSLGLSSRPAQAPAAPAPKAPPPPPAEPAEEPKPKAAEPRAAEPAAATPRAPDPKPKEPRASEPAAPEIKAPATPAAEAPAAPRRQAASGEKAVDDQRREPSLGGTADKPATETPRAEPTLAATPDEITGTSSRRERNRKRSEVRTDRALAGLDAPMRTSRLPALLGGVAVLLLLVGVAAVGYSQRHTIIDMFAGDESASDAGEATRTAEQPTAPPEEEPTGPRKNSARLLENGETAVAPDARSVTTTRITPSAPGGQRDTQETTAPAQQPRRDVTAQAADPNAGTVDPSASGTNAVQAPETPAAPEQQAEAETPASSEAPAETSGSDTATQTSRAPAASPDTASDGIVAQRAILYEEGAQPGSAGQASAGQTVWSVSEETVDGASETVLKIRVEVPERGITANLSLKPNRDSSLPASHLLEISFDLPSSFAGRGVDEVPGLVMKTTEEARGEALIGASVKVNDGFFWVALSNVPDEQERNLSLLKDRGWIDIPMLYENGKRAILTLEKGTPGTRAVDQAIAAWARS